jgi:hypothetical protein
MEQAHEKIAIDKAVGELKPLGFEKMDVLSGMTYQKANTVVVIPTREPYLHVRFHQALSALIAPPNQQRACLFAVGHEVGHAYNQMIAGILNDPVLSTWDYILTIEDDNLPPPDAHIRLLESINSNGGYDAVGGLYWTKGDVQMPMCYGDPDEFYRTGTLEFRPRDVRSAVKNGWLVPCNGLAMGCTLFRMSLFREIGYPWFVTVSDFAPNSKNVECFSQDLWFCRKAVQSGKKLACDCRVKVSHIDWRTGIAY